MKTIRIGTRNSPLARAQADWVASRLNASLEGLYVCEIKGMTTSGDQLQDRSLLEAGGKGLFTKELDIALAAGEVDLLVHSLKDVPVMLPPGQRMFAFPAREDPRDAFVSLKYERLDDLPHGAVMGTSSLRRRSQVLALRPDLKIVEFRGNVQNRLKKLQDGIADATFLAAAGLNRLGVPEHACQLLDPDHFLPAVGQGILGIAGRSDQLDADVLRALSGLNDQEAERAATAERAALAHLDGSCRTPIAAHLFHDGPGRYRLKVCVSDPSGRPVYTATQTLEGAELFLHDFLSLGHAAGAAILEQTGGQLPHLSIS
jgi:hydroxymethylbilane synthase